MHIQGKSYTKTKTLEHTFKPDRRCTLWNSGMQCHSAIITMIL